MRVLTGARVVSALLVLALVVGLLPGAVAPARATTGLPTGANVFPSGCAGDYWQTTFAINEAVCANGRVAPNPEQPTIIGDSTIHIVPTSAGPNPGAAVASRRILMLGTFLDEPVWLPNLTPGEYYMVVDEASNGTFNPEQGDAVYPDVLTVTNAVLDGYQFPVAAVKSVAHDRAEAARDAQTARSRYSRIMGYWSWYQLFSAQTSGSEFTPAAVGLVGLGWGIAVRIFNIPTSYNAAVQRVGFEIIDALIAAEIESWERLANDPADPDYEILASVDLLRIADMAEAILDDPDDPTVFSVRDDMGLALPVVGGSDEPVTVASASVATLVAERAALIEAVMRSHERFLGALDARDAAWAVTHGEALLRHLDALDAVTDAIDAASADLTAALDEQSGEVSPGLPTMADTIPEDEFVDLRQRIAADGFDRDERRALREAGLTVELQEEFRQLIVAEDDVPAGVTGIDLLHDVLALPQGLRAALADLAADVQASLDAMQAEVGAPSAPQLAVDVPAETVVAGQPVTVTAETGESASVAWDLTGDGSFEDASGTEVVFTPHRAGRHRIAAVATDDEAGTRALAGAVVVAEHAEGGPQVLSRSPAAAEVALDPNESLTFEVDADGADEITWRVGGEVAGTGSSLPFTATASPGEVAVDATLSDGDPATRDVVVDWEVVVGDRLSGADGLAISTDADGIEPGDSLGDVEVAIVDADGNTVAASGEEVSVRLVSADGLLPPLGAELEGDAAATTAADGTAVLADLSLSTQLPAGTWVLEARHGEDLLAPGAHVLTVSAPSFEVPSAVLDLAGFDTVAAPGAELSATLEVGIDDPDGMLDGDVQIDVDLRDPALGSLGDPATSVADDVLSSLVVDPADLVGQPRAPADLDGSSLSIDATVDDDAEEIDAVWVVTARDAQGRLIGSDTAPLAVRVPDPGDPQASVTLDSVDTALVPGEATDVRFTLSLGNPSGVQGDLVADLELVAVDGADPATVVAAVSADPDVLGQPLAPADLAGGLTVDVSADVALGAEPGSYGWRATLRDDRGLIAVDQAGVVLPTDPPQQPQLLAGLGAAAPAQQDTTAAVTLEVDLDDPDEVVDEPLEIVLDLRDPAGGDLLDPASSVLDDVLDSLSTTPDVLQAPVDPQDLRDGVVAEASAQIAADATPGVFAWVLEVRDGDGQLVGAAASAQEILAAPAPVVTFTTTGLHEEFSPEQDGTFRVAIAASDPAGRLPDELDISWDIRSDADDPATSLVDDLFDLLSLSPSGFFDEPVWTERLLTDGRTVRFDVRMAFDAPISDMDGFALVLEARTPEGDLVSRSTADSMVVGDDVLLPGTGGPVILTGIDPELGPIDCYHGCLSTWQDVLANVFSLTRNTGSGILVIGARTGQAVQWWTNIVEGYAPQNLPGLGVELDFVDDIADIGAVDFNDYAVVGVATATGQLSSGGITNAQNEALNARASDIATFINRGGGLMGHTQWGLSNPYAYISGIGEIVQSTSSSDVLTITEAGFEAGIQQDFEGCCWHTSFAAWPDFMEPLVFGGGGQVQVLGGRQVGIATGITLDPVRAQAHAGDAITLTATVEEDHLPVEGAEVTFTLGDGGAHEGVLGTAETGPDGTASITMVGQSIGTDTVEASYTDSNDNERVSNVSTLRWRPISSAVTYEPAEATRAVGDTHVVTATVMENDEPVEGAEVAFEVEGVHGDAVEPATVLTGDDGVAVFAYEGIELGHDVVTATTTDVMGQVWQEELLVEWDEVPIVEQCVDLIAGQHHDVGEVCAIHDDENLTVTYSTVEGWSLIETHVAVGEDLEQYALEGWLNNADNPRPGHFPYKASHVAQDSYTYTIPLSDLDGFEDFTELLLAAHAVVVDGSGQETAWGDGTRFREQGNWAMYFAYELP